MQKIYNLPLFGFVTLLLSISSVSAQTFTVLDNLYIGYQQGIAKMELPAPKSGSSVSQGGQSAHNFYFGYYFLSNKRFDLGAEFGMESYPGESLAIDNVQYSYTGSYNYLALSSNIWVTQSFGFRLSGGIAQVNQNTVSNKFTSSTSLDLPRLEAGLVLRLSPHMSANLTYQHAFGKSLSSDELTTDNQKVATVNGAYLGVQYTF